MIKKKNLFDLVLIGFAILFLDYFYFYVMSNYFFRIFGKIQKNNIKLNYLSMILTYIILIFGFYYFLIENQERNESYEKAFFLGFFAYSIFNLTNKTIFKDYTWNIVLIDSFWGGILFFLIMIFYNYVNNFN